MSCHNGIYVEALEHSCPQFHIHVFPIADHVLDEPGLVLIPPSEKAHLQLSEETQVPLHDARVWKWKCCLQQKAEGEPIKVWVLGDVRCRLRRPLLYCGHPFHGLY